MGSLYTFIFHYYWELGNLSLCQLKRSIQEKTSFCGMFSSWCQPWLWGESTWCHGTGWNEGTHIGTVMSQMLQVSFLTHRIHVWYVYLHVPYKLTKCGDTMKPEGRIGDQTFQDLEKTTNYVARLVVSQDQMLRVSFLFVPHAQAALVHSHKTLRNFLCYDRLFQ